MIPSLQRNPFCQAIAIFSMVHLVSSIRNMKLSVPEAVAVGDTVTLSCQYDLENETLYLMRWTFDSVEFFRYVPKEEPAARSFDTSGVTVDMRKSNSHNVTIRSLSLNQTGVYQCEVSADAPLFHTVAESAHLQVAVLPDAEPAMNIYGALIREDNKRQIHYGDQLKASCIASPSLPTVNFTWRLNGVIFPATTSGYRDNNGIIGPSWESRDAWSELLFVVDNYFFARIGANKLHGPQTLRIRCETNMYSLYRGAAELDMEIVDDSLLLNGIGNFGGIVSPTIDLRGGGGSSSSHKNDPDNSALTGCGVRLQTNTVMVVFGFYLFFSSSFLSSSLLRLVTTLLCGALDIRSSLSFGGW